MYGNGMLGNDECETELIKRWIYFLNCCFVSLEFRDDYLLVVYTPLYGKMVNAE